ncbi:MAG: branched-chain amino acid ABC transporter permease [Armatimonadota bacterium]|nr:branched-chain amino acid ABC transporter permease [Armatimonadota bacterium]
MTVPARLATLLAVAGLASLPLWAPRFLLTVAAEVLIFGIAATSLNLLLGYTGLISMGHAAYFATGGYVAGLLAKHVTPLFWATTPVGMVAAAALALVVGAFALRTAAVTFLMITLAVGQMLYALAIKWRTVTGGSDGLLGIPKPTGLGVEMDAPRMYLVALVCYLLVLWFLRRLLAAPFGRTLVGIRENEGRLRALGCNVQAYKLAAFVLAGGLAGLGGALFGQFNGFIAPSEIHWHRSGQLMIMIIIGGVHSLIGPLLGAFVVVAIQDLVSSLLTQRWMTVMGLVFIGFVLVARGGLVGLWHALHRAVRRGLPVSLPARPLRRPARDADVPAPDADVPAK